MNKKDYTYTLHWSAEDEEWVALCPSFHSLSWLDASPSKAVGGILNLVEDTLRSMELDGDTPPRA